MQIGREDAIAGSRFFFTWDIGGDAEGFVSLVLS